MANITIRNTYAFDVDTVETIKRLAAEWNVSQSEVIRRSVRIADEKARAKRSPYDALIACFENPESSEAQVQERQEEAYRIRKSWREKPRR